MYRMFSLCPKPESNQRHEDFQSSALPTELFGHISARRDSNPRPSPWQGDALPTEPLTHIW